MGEYPEKKRADDKAMFDDVVQAILSVMGDDVIKIILYGSVARGDNDWDSDVDIAVLTTQNYNHSADDSLDDVILTLDMKYDTLFSVITIEAKRFYDWVDDLPFYHNVDLEGIKLWTKEEGRICLDTALNEQKKNLVFREIY